MFLDPKFFIFNLSTFLLFIWFMIPYLYIPDHMLKFHYVEEDSARLISVIGLFNTVGMLVLGIFGDRPWINVPKVYAVCLVSEYSKSFSAFLHQFSFISSPRQFVESPPL